MKTFENQNARKKIRVEAQNGILVEIPIAELLRTMAETWAEELALKHEDGHPARVCFGIPSKDDATGCFEMIYLTISNEHPHERDERVQKGGTK